MKNQELYIILVNWNKPYLTLSCVESIKKSLYKYYQIIVVNNGSVDNSWDLLNANKSNFHLINSDKNLGYTGGNNLGIKYALDQKAKYILLLNNDTLIECDTLLNLINVISNDKKIGIVQPKIYYYPNKDLIWSGPTYYNKFLMRPKLLGNKKVGLNLYNTSENLEYAVGCATLIRSEVFQKIGLLDDDYFAVCEDVDFGLRTKIAGFEIIYVPSSLVYHMESVSSGGSDNPNYIYLQTRAFLLLFKKNAKNKLHLFVVLIFYIFSTFRRILLLLFNKNIKGVYSICIAYKNFFIKKGNVMQKIR